MAKIISGLDLGQKTDFAAFVVLAVSRKPSPLDATVTENHFQCGNIYRWPLGTPYPQIVRDLQKWYTENPLAGSTLIVDGTGVGAPVVDMVREAGFQAKVKAYAITAGRLPNEEKGTVPKVDLVAAVDAALQTGRLTFADVPLAKVLRKELETFKMKVTADRNETFGAWREGENDDCVLALALATWWAETNWSGDGGWVGPSTTRAEELAAWRRQW